METSAAAAQEATFDASRRDLVVDSVAAGYYSQQRVLNGISLHARAGQVTVVLGPNGSGKSTLLRVLYGLLVADEGSVTLGGEDITTVAPDERLDHGMALLPQGRSLFPSLTVAENLELGCWTMRRDRARMREAIERVTERYPLVGDLSQRMAGSLSGGQQRLVELGRMLLTDPSVLLIDEPSVGLSPKLATEIYEELAKLSDEGRTIVLVDQNVQAAVELADYVYTLESGRNYREGAKAQFEGELEALIREWLRLSTDGEEQEGS